MAVANFPAITRGGRQFSAIFLALGFVFFVGNALAQKELAVRGPFVAKEAGITFPEKVGEFQRVNITIYSPDQKDLSAGYNLMDSANPIVATVYIYPARRVLSFGSPREVVEEAHDKLEQMEMDSIIREISNAHRGARLITQEPVRVTAGGRALHGRHVRFAYQEDFAGKRQPLLGDVWLITVRKWYLKYRVTYPAGNEARAMSDIKKLMNALPVPSGT